MLFFNFVRTGYTLLVTLLIVLIVFTLAGCSGSGQSDSATVPEIASDDALLQFSMPQIPTGENDVRHGNVVDSDFVQGAAFVESRGATIDGTAVLIEAGTTPADITAFTVYQHVSRPAPEVPYMVSVLGYHQDPDPTDIDPNEGYYVLYADYNLGRWVTAGFFDTTFSRVQFPPVADVVSPSGFIYTAVVAYNSNTVRVSNVYMGYDVGAGYEQYVLPEVPGLAVGASCDIELDDAGVPQIAYLVDSSLIDAYDSFIRISRLVGDVWETEDITIVDDPVFFDFAVGSGGRRALIVFDDLGEQYLLYDNNTGTFVVEYDSLLELLANKPVRTVNPAITFINSIDDPLGDLDTALVVYGIPSGVDIATRYLRADGLVPPVPGQVAGLSTLKVTDIGLTTFTDNKARVAVQSAGLVESDCIFGMYNAVVDSWGPSGIDNWEELYLGFSNYEGVLFRDIDTVDVIACYRSAEEGAFVFGVWDGVTWTSNPSDHVSCNPTPSERGIDFESDAIGMVAFPTVYGNYSPVVYYGDPGNATPFEPNFINEQPFSCGDISIAIDSSDVLHFARERPMDGQVIYSTMEMGVMNEEQVVDHGADGNALGFGPAPIVADGDALHIFHLDYAHGQIVYSRNVAGIWEEEQLPVLPVPQYPYLLNQAGLLEETGEIYVSYIDYFDSVWRVLISDANQETWRVEDITQFISEYLVVEDDENSIAAAYYRENLITSDVALYVELGIGRNGPRTIEMVSNNEDLIRPPTSMAYNSFNDSWYIALNDGSLQRGYLFHRVAPGTWQGPFTIDEQSTGVDATLVVIGLACRNSDGQLSALITEQDHGSTIQNFSSLVSDPEVIDFGTKTLVNSFDEALFDSDWSAFSTTDDEGELAMLLIRHLLGDPLHDALMFTEDSGAWSFEMWDSPITKRLDWYSTGFAIMGDGAPAATLVEYDITDPLFGRVFVYYPW